MVTVDPQCRLDSMHNCNYKCRNCDCKCCLRLTVDSLLAVTMTIDPQRRCRCRCAAEPAASGCVPDHSAAGAILSKGGASFYSMHALLLRDQCQWRCCIPYFSLWYPVAVLVAIFLLRAFDSETLTLPQAPETEGKEEPETVQSKKSQ